MTLILIYFSFFENFFDPPKTIILDLKQMKTISMLPLRWIILDLEKNQKFNFF